MERRSFSPEADVLKEEPKPPVFTDEERKAMRDRSQARPKTGIGTSALFSTGLAAASIFGLKEVVPPLREAYQHRLEREAREPLEAAERAKELREAQQEHDRVEAIHQERHRFLEQTQRELREGTFDLGRFLIRAGALDAREDEKRDINLVTAEAELVRLTTRFQEYVSSHSPVSSATITQALRYATDTYRTTHGRVQTPYQYHNVSGMTFPDGLNEQTGKCPLGTGIGLSVPQRAGYGRYLGMRVYEAPEGGRSRHVAPVFLVPNEDGSTEETDLLSGGPGFQHQGVTQGLLIGIPEVVAAYARYAEQHPTLPVSQYTRIAIQARRRADTGTGRFAIYPDVTREHFEWPTLPPNLSEEFPRATPAVGGALFGIYESDRNGAIRWHINRPPPQHELSGASIDSTPFSDALASRYWGSPENIRTYEPFTPLTHHDAEHTSREIIHIDTRLQEEPLLSRQAVLLASSCFKWNQIGDMTVSEQHPQSAQHPYHMARIRARELHTVLGQITPEQFVRELRLSEDSSRDIELEFFQMQVRELTLDHERGWPLLFQVVQRADMYRVDTYVRRHILAQLLVTATRPDEQERLWTILRRYSIRERQETYQTMGTGAEFAIPVLDEEVRLYQVSRDGRTVVERITGYIHRNNPNPDRPATSLDPNTPILEMDHPPRPTWRTPEDVAHWVEQHPSYLHVAEGWQASLAWSAITEVNGYYLDFPRQSVERPILRQFMQDGLRWLGAHRLELLEAGYSNQELQREEESLLRHLADE